MTSANNKKTSNNTSDISEYRDPQDGLLHCSVCREPKEIRRRLWGREYTPRIKCKCERDRDIAYETSYQKRERVANAMRWKAATLMDKEMWHSKFEDDLGFNATETAYARQYVERWEDMYSTGKGLLLSGEPGTGKTYLACCIGNALVGNGVPVLMTTVSKIIEAYGEIPFSDRASMTASVRFYDLLIIDDLGAERNTDYVKDILYKIINAWYSTGKPLIITTNLSVKELRNTEDTSLSQIYSRVLELCVPVLVNTTNVRKIIAEKNKDELKSVLSGTSSSNHH